jgi:hypothetical protein
MGRHYRLSQRRAKPSSLGHEDDHAACSKAITTTRMVLGLIEAALRHVVARGLEVNAAELSVDIALRDQRLRR